MFEFAKQNYLKKKELYYTYQKLDLRVQYKMLY